MTRIIKNIRTAQHTAFFALALLAIFAMAASRTAASTVTYQTPNGAFVLADDNTTHLNVNAKATLTTSNDTINIKIENFQANPLEVKQIVYALLFKIGDGTLNAGTLSSWSGLSRTIDSAGNNPFTDAGIVTSPADSWTLYTDGLALHLDALGTGQPQYGIIGGPNPGDPSHYTNANGSIAGNGPHNPFFALSADFVLSVPGVTSDSLITAVQFSFGTAQDASRRVVNGNAPTSAVPEPSAYVLGLIGLAGLGCVAWRKKYRRA